MPNGPLFTETGSDPPDGTPSSESSPSAKTAVKDAKESFPDSPPSPVLVCEPTKTPPATPTPCSADQLKANIAKCDGGTGVWNKAKTEVGQDPGVEVGTAAGGFGGHADCADKKVVIAPNPDCCGATQTLVVELTNLSNCSRFSQNHTEASAGNLDREAYTKAYERLEYDSVKNSIASFDKCSKSWGCAEGSLARHGGYRSAKNFDDYYDNYLPDSHKNYYRDNWDKSFKKIYEKKHPPPP